MSDLKIKSIKSLHYHRNGICGDGFYQVIFLDGDKDEFQAILPGNHADFHEGGVECYVTLLSDPTATWRGDEFFGALKQYFSITQNRKGLEQKWVVKTIFSVDDFLKTVFNIDTRKEAPDAAQIEA